MHLFSIAVALLAFVGSAVAQDASPDALKDLAPTGKLRAATNLGNGVLAQKDPASSEPKGITPDLARELAKRLGVPLEMDANAGCINEVLGRIIDRAVCPSAGRMNVECRSCYRSIRLGSGWQLVTNRPHMVCQHLFDVVNPFVVHDPTNEIDLASV